MPNRRILAAGVLLTMLAGSALAQTEGRSNRPFEVTWQRDDWDPNPQPDDVLLPLPCGGAMAFRRVVTGPPRGSAGNYLEDREVIIGSPEQRLGYLAYQRTDWVSGGFFDPDGKRFYLIGKYEVTTQQFDAVMRSCAATPADRAALPVSDVSWFDAIEFTRRLNAWLYEERQNLIPKSWGLPGFVRLPSEVEWEFAARGGLAVSDADRSNPTFVPPGASLSDYAWFAGAESSAGELKPIGSVKANPLGLYDMLGNVEELILESFRLNRAGRPHGEFGGFVTRGASYQTPREGVRSSARTEFPLFEATSKGELHLPTIGFRIAVGSVTFGDANLASAFQGEWDNARRTDGSLEGRNLLEAVETMLNEVAPTQRTKLRNAIAKLSAEVRARNELEGRALKGLLAAALAIRNSLTWTAEYLDQLHIIITVDSKQGGVQAEVARRAQTRYDIQRQNFDGYVTAYADLIQQMAKDFRAEELRRQAEALKHEFTTRSRQRDLPAVDATVNEVGLYREGKLNRVADTLRAVVGPRAWLPR